MKMVEFKLHKTLNKSQQEVILRARPVYFDVPTEVIIPSKNPHKLTGRYYPIHCNDAELFDLSPNYLEKNDSKYYQYQYVCEVYSDHGMDGHLDNRMVGYVFINQEYLESFTIFDQGIYSRLYITEESVHITEHLPYYDYSDLQDIVKCWQDWWQEYGDEWYTRGEFPLKEKPPFLQSTHEMYNKWIKN